MCVFFFVFFSHLIGYCKCQIGIDVSQINILINVNKVICGTSVLIGHYVLANELQWSELLDLVKILELYSQ